MISGLDLKASVPFSLEEDKENPTVWEIGLLPSILFAKLSTTSKDNELETTFKIVQLSLRGWKNFDVDFKTEEQEFFGRKYQVVPIELLERIPLAVIGKIAEKAMEINQVTDTEAKN